MYNCATFATIKGANDSGWGCSSLMWRLLVPGVFFFCLSLDLLINVIVYKLFTSLSMYQLIIIPTTSNMRLLPLLFVLTLVIVSASSNGILKFLDDLAEAKRIFWRRIFLGPEHQPPGPSNVYNDTQLTRPTYVYNAQTTTTVKEVYNATQPTKPTNVYHSSTSPTQH